MAGPIPIGPFSMPMYRDWVPKQIRPWIYVLMLIMFQLTGCIYLGVVSQITGTTGLMRDDIMFIGICNVIGVNMPFPFLFRYKFRFTNRQLLLNAALVIIACNLLALVFTNGQWSIFNGQWPNSERQSRQRHLSVSRFPDCRYGVLRRLHTYRHG